MPKREAKDVPFPAHSEKPLTLKQSGTAKLPRIDCLASTTSNYAPEIVSAVKKGQLHKAMYASLHTD